MYLYADDAKADKAIQSKGDSKILQLIIISIKEWSDMWLLPLNIEKCKTISYSLKEKIDTDYYIQEGNNTYHFGKGSVISENFLIQLCHSESTYHKKINKAFSMIGIIKRNLIHMDAKTFILLYKALVQPHIEYANSVWHPCKKGDIENISEKSHKTC